MGSHSIFGQLTEDSQNHSGSGSSVNVQYAYDTGDAGSSEIRLNQVTYPNGRTIAYSYGTSGEASDSLRRDWHQISNMGCGRNCCICSRPWQVKDFQS
jgi:hypothetical protein